MSQHVSHRASDDYARGYQDGFAKAQEQPRQFTAEERRAIRHCAVSAMEKTAPCCTEASHFVMNMLGRYDPALESAESEAFESGKYE